jgi:hypothetical protein
MKDSQLQAPAALSPEKKSMVHIGYISLTPEAIWKLLLIKILISPCRELKAKFSAA